MAKPTRSWPRFLAPGQRFLVREPYRSYFPAAESPGYDAFLNADGDPVKSEPRTRIVIMHRQAAGTWEKTMRSFVLKIYRYPFLPRLRTGFRISKAEREFNSLRYINEQGVRAGDPVAFGVERTRLGFVRSCFVITSFVEGAINLSQWRSESAHDKHFDHGRTHFLLRQVGAMFRRLHEARFFLFTAKTKNLLIRTDSAAATEIFFIDVPYARTLRWGPVARWAQHRDLGFFLASFFPALTQNEQTSFYEGYLPDPLGGSPMALRHHAQQAMWSKQNLTPISALTHSLKRTLRSAWRSTERFR
ncbi:MAG TPA: lipopolysaccharide kinase InaA family protein [Candidatus Binatia bacterium]|nr:lipopolysaccharide kinase InaA family protein [Candidatus Binatia bacterium]